MDKTFFFYDLETSGLNQRADRIMQFAGQRTDMELNPIGEPVNILVKLTDDALPSPAAIMVTKITPQETLRDGISEAEFCKYVTNEVFVPNTIALGFNTVRFDDEFMRATLWRNFYDPYEWEWKDGRSRWDMLDVVRLTRALRPEGIEWPVTEDGKPTNRLELITKLNGLKHEHAHDALSDVYATIAVARLIREKQPEMFEYMLRMRDKRQVMKLVDLDNPQPVVYASGKYNSEHNKTTVVIPVAHGRNGNVLVYDLRYNPERFLVPAGTDSSDEDSSDAERVLPDLSSPSSPSLAGGPPTSPSPAYVHIREDCAPNPSPDQGKRSFFPIIKELCFNKCPAVAPLAVLNKADGWKKIGLSLEEVKKNLQSLRAHPEIIERAVTEMEARPEWPPAEEPEQALYDGFLNGSDRVKVAAVRNADKNKLADFHPDFHDLRLPELLLHYKGRNYPESLDANEAKKWEEYRHARLSRQAPKFMAELEKNYARDEFVAEELKLYFESLLNYD